MCKERRSHFIFAAAASVSVFLTVPTATYGQIVRAQGVDVSDWQGTVNWTTVKNAGKSFAFIRATRGGTTGSYNEHALDANGNSAPTGTLSQRYDDTQFRTNIVAATAKGIYTGFYHFDRADVAGNTGVDEANHFLQVAGPWMRPGYLVPVLDLEAGSGMTRTALTNWALDFINTIVAAKHITPIVYVNASYANDEVDSRLGAYPLWLARPSGDLVSGEPVAASGYPDSYGVWDPAFVVGGTHNTDPALPHPWKFWQNGTATFSGATADLDAANGGTEFLKDYLVPAMWNVNASGDWSSTSNWNTNYDPNDLLTSTNDPNNYMAYHNDQTRGGAVPVPRLPGVDDTVTLNRAAYTATLSTGSQSIRKLYVQQPFNITGGSLTIGYVPSADSTTFSAQFSQAVTLSGSGALSVHTLVVDAARTFTLSGGTLTLNTMGLGAATSNPGKLLINGSVTINPLSNAAAVIGSTTVAGQISGTIDLGGATETINVGDGSADADLSFNVPVSNGSIYKDGAGTLVLNKTTTLNNTVSIARGVLRVTANGQLGTTGVVSLVTPVVAGSSGYGGTLQLSNNVSYSVPMTINGAGKLGIAGSGGTPSSPGGPGALDNLSGNNTFAGAITLMGAGANGTDPTINQISATAGNLTLSGVISSGATGSGALAKSGSGTVILTGSSANTYTGLTRQYGGTLILEKDGALGSAASPTYQLAGSASTVAFRAPGASAGFNYATQEYIFTEGTGASGLGQVDNISGNNTFAGSIGITGSGNVGSIGVSAGSLTIGGGLYARSGSGQTRTINKVGTGTLILTGDSSLAPASGSALALVSLTINVSAGTLDLRGPTATKANVPGVTTYTVASGATLKNTTGTLSGAAITVNGSLVQTNGRLAGLTLSVGDNATAKFNVSASVPSVVTNLTLTSLAQLDLTTNTLVYDYTGTTPADVVRQKLLTGRNGGAWTGKGIISSSAVGGQSLTAIGYIEASVLPATTANALAAGASFDSTSLLLTYTYYGDANLDGVVDVDDYALLDRGFAKHLTGWVNGDFDYSGTIDSGDYALMDRVYVQQGAPLSAEFLAEREAQFGEQYVSQLVASVPEPSVMGVGVLGMALGGRARRRRR